MPFARPGQKLRDAAEDSTLMIPGAFNALVGRMIEEAGFPALYLSGAAFLGRHAGAARRRPVHAHRIGRANCPAHAPVSKSP